jgi:hypothetical protein
MAVITPPSGGTTNATTIEGQIWQLAHWADSAERLLTTASLFTLTKDSFVGKCEFKLPSLLSFNASTGLFTMTADVYSPGVFTPGTGGTIKATTFAQFFLDTVLYMVNWQGQQVKNPQGIRYVALSLNPVSKEWTGTVDMPYISALGTSGGVIETATEWLAT